MKHNLFISKKTKISRDSKSLKLEFEDETKKIPLGVIENLFLIGNSIHLTNGARGLMLENNKNIFFYTSNYNMQGVLSNTKLQSNYRLRLFQYEAFNTKSFPIAQMIVQQKGLQMQKAFSANIKISGLINKVFKTQKINELLGMEGAMSAVMFKVFKSYLQVAKIEDFKKREYRPTKDKINGVLSFTYTLYSNLLYGLVLAEGYDPYIGFLHQKRGTHYAFVSDLIEFDRPHLTKFVLILFTKHILNNDDFDGIFLNYDGRKKFLIHFNEFAKNHFEQSKANLDLIGEYLV